MEISFIIKPIILIINAIGVWLLILIVSHREKISNKILYLFGGMIFLMFLWVDFAYLARIVPPHQGLLFIKLGWATGPLFFILIYLFIKAFFTKIKYNKYSVFETTLLAIGAINVPVVLLTPWII